MKKNIRYSSLLGGACGIGMAALLLVLLRVNQYVMRPSFVWIVIVAGLLPQCVSIVRRWNFREDIVIGVMIFVSLLIVLFYAYSMQRNASYAGNQLFFQIMTQSVILHGCALGGLGIIINRNKKNRG